MDYYQQEDDSLLGFIARVVILVCCIFFVGFGLPKASSEEGRKIVEVTLDNQYWHSAKWCFKNVVTGQKVWGEIPPYKKTTVRIPQGVYTFVYRVDPDDGPKVITVTILEDTSWTFKATDLVTAKTKYHWQGALIVG